jgi:hypothetical protein
MLGGKDVTEIWGRKKLTFKGLQPKRQLTLSKSVLEARALVSSMFCSMHHCEVEFLISMHSFSSDNNPRPSAPHFHLSQNSNIQGMGHNLSPKPFHMPPIFYIRTMARYKICFLCGPTLAAQLCRVSKEDSCIIIWDNYPALVLRI